jgi:chromosome partitioning protein
MGVEGHVRGIGWPSRESRRQARGLGWPIEAGRDSEDVAEHIETTAASQPESSQASQVSPDVDPQDAEGAVAGEQLDWAPSDVAVATSAADHGGMADQAAVTDVDLTESGLPPDWAAPNDVSRETSPVDPVRLRGEWGSTAPNATLVQPWQHTIHLPGERGAVAVVTEVRSPLVAEGLVSAATDLRDDAVLSRGDDDVSRETATAQAAMDDPLSLVEEPAFEPQTRVTESAGEQVSIEAEAMRRATTEPSATAWQPPGAPLAPPMPSLGLHATADDSDRVQLVASLPRVDDSTPLAAEVAEDARRRISLTGKAFPRPPHTRILTVANQKGGVGKTTTAVNVAAALAQAGLSVLVLDIDPQGNASTALGVDHHSEVPSLYDVVVEDRPLAEVVQACPDLPNLWCGPATIDLAGAEIELVSFVARETRLKKALETYLGERVTQGLDQIDYVLIDCPPSLSLLTVNAFVAAREVLIPIQCEYYALEGLSQLLKHIELIRKQLNPSLHVSTILLTMYDGRTRLSSQVADEVRTHFPEQVVRTSVPRSVRISEAPSHSQTVMTYDPASSGALSYLEAARELAEQVLTWEPTQHEEKA